MSIEIEIEQLIAKYLAGEASCEDIISISDWLKEDPRNKDTFMMIKEYWEANVSRSIEIDHSKVFDTILREIKTSTPNRSIRTRKQSYSYIAAIAAVFIGLLLYVAIPNTTTEIHTYTYYSGNANTKFDLPDGTHISLNKNSSLTYNDSFNHSMRKVSLEGEAYFEVTKDVDKPFIVDLDESQIIVLGTIFNVKNKSDEDITSATLLEGAIRFEAPDQNVFMVPQQQLSYNKITKTINLAGIDIDTEMARKNNLIKYNSLSFVEVIKILEESYNITIALENRILEDEIVTGTFDRNLNIEQILNILQSNIKFKWKKIRDEAYLIF